MPRSPRSVQSDIEGDSATMTDDIRVNVSPHRRRRLWPRRRRRRLRARSGSEYERGPPVRLRPSGGRRPDGPGAGGPAADGHAADARPALDLTDAQKDRIKAIADSHQGRVQGARDRARAAQQALEDAITADTIDERPIRQKSADVAAVDADWRSRARTSTPRCSRSSRADQKAQLQEDPREHEETQSSAARTARPARYAAGCGSRRAGV